MHGYASNFASRSSSGPQSMSGYRSNKTAEGCDIRAVTKNDWDKGAIENVGKLEVSKLEKNISILGIIAGIAPMLGFVGTIIGVITIFHEVSVKGIIEIGTISGGLYVKMITSATGLIIGIIAYVLYHILNIMVDRIILKMETDAIEFIDLLEEPGK